MQPTERILSTWHAQWLVRTYDFVIMLICCFLVRECQRILPVVLTIPVVIYNQLCLFAGLLCWLAIYDTICSVCVCVCVNVFKSKNDFLFRNNFLPYFVKKISVAHCCDLFLFYHFYLYQCQWPAAHYTIHLL